MLYRETELKHYGVLGMKWGVRRYQNADGTLTEAGKKRSFHENSSTKKPKKADPDRWVTEDLRNAKTVVDSNKILARTAKTLNTTASNKHKTTVDTSKLTSHQMQEQLNRRRLEKEYIKEFSQPVVSKGRKRVDKILNASSTVLDVASTTIGMAIALKELGAL